AVSLHLAVNGKFNRRLAAASGVLALAIVSLHFTGMTAFKITPLSTAGAFTDHAALQAMALAIALVGMIVVGT
ncbi:hypothetical protein LXJ56_30460, partial [Escherichia coli]|nr:hypothetical protein [Escherichia coli]